MKKSRVIFDKKALEKAILDNIVNEQTNLFVEYAEKKIRLLGDAIMLYHSKNHMDRTGNLLDSLCWGVVYNNKVVESGFYRQKTASKDSYLHEWFSGDYAYLYPVNGHKFAEEYINSYGKQGKGGWKVFFAILAPYWGYWENGFTLKSKFGGSARFARFAVMTELFDEVKQELKPARVRFRHPVAKYTREGIEKRREKDFEGKIKDYYKYGNPNFKMS